MQYRVTNVKTKNGKGTFALVDKIDGLSYRSVGVTRTFWTASQAYRARVAGRNMATRHYKKNMTVLTGPLVINDE